MREAELLGGICGEESLSEFGGQCSEAGFVGGGGFEDWRIGCGIFKGFGRGRIGMGVRGSFDRFGGPCGRLSGGGSRCGLTGKRVGVRG